MALDVMTDEEVHAALLRYNPEYKKSIKPLTENERQIRLKQLHHFQVRERKEQEAKLKEEKLKEKLEKEAQRKEKEGQRKTKKNESQLSISVACETSFDSSAVTDLWNGTSNAQSSLVESMPPSIEPKKRGRKTSNASDSSVNSASASLDTSNAEKASEMQKNAELPTRRGRISKRRSEEMSNSSAIEADVPIVEPPKNKRGRSLVGSTKNKKILPPPEEEKKEIVAKTLLSPIKETNEDHVVSSSGVKSPEKTSYIPGITKNLTGNISGGVEVSIVDVTLGRPACNLNLALYLLDGKQNWKMVSQSQTQSRGKCKELVSGGKFNKGLYKLHFDTAAYYKLLNIVPVFPIIEIVFEVTNTTQNHEITVDIGPYHYATHITYA